MLATPTANGASCGRGTAFKRQEWSTKPGLRASTYTRALSEISAKGLPGYAPVTYGLDGSTNASGATGCSTGTSQERRVGVGEVSLSCQGGVGEGESVMQTHAGSKSPSGCP